MLLKEKPFQHADPAAVFSIYDSVRESRLVRKPAVTHDD